MMTEHAKAKVIKLVFLVLLLSSSVSGLLCEEEKAELTKIKNNYVKVGANYFIPSEQSFKDLYGEGLMFGGEVNIKLWKFIDLWLIGNYYSKKGNLSFSKEETEMTLVPLGGGLKIRFLRGRINPYVGIGPVFYIYEENNPIGVADGTDMGIIGQAGCYLRLIGGLILDVSINYSYCEVKPQRIKANLGGIQAGVGLGFEF